MNGSAAIRVVFVLTTPDAAGGTERATYRTARGLAGRPGLDVSVLGVFAGESRPHFADEIHVPVHRLIARDEAPAGDGRADRGDPPQWVDPRWERSFTGDAERAVAAWLDSNRPDVVIVTSPALLALAVAVAPSSTRIVAAEHRASATRGATSEPLRRFAPMADAVVSLTADGTEWFTRVLGSRAPRLATIPNAIPDPLAPRSTLSEPMVIAAGRIVPSKQFTHAVDAFARARRPPWRMRLFGDGPQRRAVERQVVASGVHDHLDVVPMVPDLASELAKSSLLMMTSMAEGQPLVALEALAAGVPILSYDCPVGPRSIIDHGVNGLLVPPNDRDALARCLAELIDDEDLRRRLGQGALAARGRFEIEMIAARWHDLLTEVMAVPVRRSEPGSGRNESRSGTSVVDPILLSGGDEPWVPRGGLLVHIGPHKTGTTALQSACAAARELLAQQGIIFPGPSPAPHGAVMNRLGTARGWDDSIPPGSTESWEQLCVQSRVAPGTVFISSEAFCHATVDQAREVLDELRPGPARVLITLRRLDQILPSSWQEYVKSGWTLGFDAFCHAVLDDPLPERSPVPTFWLRQDHGAVVERWVAAIGAEHITVVIADPSRPEHLVGTVERLLGASVGTLRADAGPANRSLTVAEVELLRRVNLAVRDETAEPIAWSWFNRILRQGGTPRLVETRVPSVDEARLVIPQWAHEPIRRHAERAVERISAAGVRIEGDLRALVDTVPVDTVPVDTVLVDTVPVDAVPVDTVLVDTVLVDTVPVDTVARVLAGMLAKLDQLETEAAPLSGRRDA